MFDRTRFAHSQGRLRWLICAAVSRQAVCYVCVGSAAMGCGPQPPRDASQEVSVADWNSRGIAWLDYAEGLSEAKRTGKPIILILYTDWCPHCHNYSRVFHDAEVVRGAASFVMIRVERDGNPDISALYAPDGEYVPRTFFLEPDGGLRRELRGDNPEYQYYVDEDDPEELLGLMRRALETK